MQQLDRRAAVLGLALLQLARLLVRVDVADEAVRVGVARRSRAASRPARRARCGRRRRPRGRRAAARRRARGSRRPTGRGSARARRGGRRRAAGRSAARGGRRLGDGERHRVRLLVRRPVGPVVHVVELADGAVAGGGHLGVDAAGDLAHRVRLERPGQPVHLLAPAPEVVVRPLAALADAPQVALERVRVHVGHRRDPRTRVTSSCAARQQRRWRRRARVVERDLLVGRVADAGLVAHQHHPGGPGGGDHAGVVAGVADEPRLRRPQARQQRVAHLVRELGARRPRGGPQLEPDARLLRHPRRSRPRPSRATTRRSPPRAPARRATGARARARWSASSARPPCGRR